MEFFQFYQNRTFYTDVAVIRPLKCQNLPFVSHLLAEDPGLSIASVLAILTDFDKFLQIRQNSIIYTYLADVRPF